MFTLPPLSPDVPALPSPPELRKLWDPSGCRTGTQIHTESLRATRWDRGSGRKAMQSHVSHWSGKKSSQRRKIPGGLLPEGDSVGCSGGGETSKWGHSS